MSHLIGGGPPACRRTALEGLLPLALELQNLPTWDERGDGGRWTGGRSYSARVYAPSRCKGALFFFGRALPALSMWEWNWRARSQTGMLDEGAPMRSVCWGSDRTPNWMRNIVRHARHSGVPTQGARLRKVGVGSMAQTGM